MCAEDVMYSMATIVNNSVLYIQKLLRINLKSSQEKFITMWNDGC